MNGEEREKIEVEVGEKKRKQRRHYTDYIKFRVDEWDVRKEGGFWWVEKKKNSDEVCEGM